MIAKKSPFILKDFFLLRQELILIHPGEKEKKQKIVETFKSYGIEMDYAIKEGKNSLFRIFVKIEVNRDGKNLPGYSIFSEGVGFFEFDKAEILTDTDRGTFLTYSGISICINSLRSIISGTTSYCPFGKYTLPSIDVNKLVQEKSESMKRENLNKKSRLMSKTK